MLTTINEGDNDTFFGADEGLKMIYLSTKDGLFMFRGETNEETQEWLQKITNIVSGQFSTFLQSLL
jgi:hypothetical protein